jgi:hypothetical protein
MYQDIIDANRTAYEEGHSHAHTLSSLIDPSDVIEGADRWSDISDERLTQEVGESVEVIMSENQLEGVVRELAVTLWRDDLPRVSMDDMAFESKEKAVKEGYWPNSMDKWGCKEILFEQTIPSDVYRESQEVVEMGIIDKMHPKRSEGDFKP